MTRRWLAAAVVFGMLGALSAAAAAQVPTSDDFVEGLPAVSGDGAHIALPIAEGGAEHWSIDVMMVDVGLGSDAKAKPMALHYHPSPEAGSEDTDNSRAVSKALKKGGYTALPRVAVPEGTIGTVPVGDLEVVFAEVATSDTEADLAVSVRRGGTEVAATRWTEWRRTDDEGPEGFETSVVELCVVHAASDLLYVHTRFLAIDALSEAWTKIEVPAPPVQVVGDVDPPPAASADGQTVLLPGTATSEMGASSWVDLVALGASSGERVTVREDAPFDDEPDPAVVEARVQAVAALNERLVTDGFHRLPVAEVDAKRKASVGGLQVTFTGKRTTAVVKRGKKLVGKAKIAGRATAVVLAGRWLYVESEQSINADDPASGYTSWTAVKLK